MSKIVYIETEECIGCESCVEICPEVFRGFKIKPVTLKYTVSKGKQTTGRELLVMNC